MAYGRDKYVYLSNLTGQKFEVSVSRDAGAIEGQETVAGPGISYLAVSRQGRKKGLQARRLKLRREIAPGGANFPPRFAYANPVIFTKASLDLLLAEATVTYAGAEWQVVGADDEDRV